VLFICITRLTSYEIFSKSNKIHWEVGRAKDLSAPRLPRPHGDIILIITTHGKRKNVKQSEDLKFLIHKEILESEHFEGKFSEQNSNNVLKNVKYIIVKKTLTVTLLLF